MKQEKSTLWRFVLHNLIMILLLMCVARPQMAKAETVESYELFFNPRTTGLPEELDKGNTDFAYKDFELRSNGEAKQAVYRTLEEVANSFWGCTENLTAVEGAQYALLATIHTANLNLSAEELIEVYLMFKNDHPVYYFLSNTVSVSGTDLLVMTNVVNGTDRANMEKNLVDYLKGYASCIDVTSDYLIAKALHDTLIGKLDYSYEDDGVTPEDAYWAHSIEGAVMRKQGVCEAYAKTYQMLLNYYGIENVYVTGVAGGDNHAWNMVKLDDGLYYYVDATWNDTASTEQYFACGKDFTKEHTSNTPDGVGGNYLYGLPEVAEDDYEEKVAVYQDGELIGRYTSFEKAFESVTDENGQYSFELIGSAEEKYYLPEGEWPKAKLLEFMYKGNDPDTEYYSVTSLVFTGNVYLNSDVKFFDVSLDCAVDVYASEDIPTLYAGTYTMYFSGKGNYLGASNVIVSPEEVYSMGIRIEGPEATLVSDASDRFEIYASDVTIGTVYMNSWFSIRGGNFTCDSLTFSEEVDRLTLSSFYNMAINLDVENMQVEAVYFYIFNDFPSDNNAYRIGKLSQKEGEYTSLTMYTTICTGKKIPSAITVESFENLEYIIKYLDTSDYTKEQLEELCQEANEEGDSPKYNYYYDFLKHMTWVERYPSEESEDVRTYQGSLLNIGSTDLANLSMWYSIEKNYVNDEVVPGDGCVDDFLEVDENGTVSRKKDELIVIEDGVLKKAKFFNRSNVSFVIPETVTAIASDVDIFDGVTELIITKNVEQLETAYFGHVDFSCITVVEENKTYSSLDGVLYNKEFTTLVFCPSKKTGTLNIPDSVTSINFNAFTYSNLNEVVIPASIQMVGNLRGNWETVYVDAKEVVSNAFYDNRKLNQLTFGKNVKKISGYVCEICNKLEKIYVLNPNVELDEYAFAYTGNYTEGREKGFVTTIYGYAGSTAEEYVTMHGEEYGLVFSELPTTPLTANKTITFENVEVSSATNATYSVDENGKFLAVCDGASGIYEICWHLNESVDTSDYYKIVLECDTDFYNTAGFHWYTIGLYSEGKKIKSRSDICADIIYTEDAILLEIGLKNVADCMIDEIRLGGWSRLTTEYSVNVRNITFVHEANEKVPDTGIYCEPDEDFRVLYCFDEFDLSAYAGKNIIIKFDMKSCGYDLSIPANVAYLGIYNVLETWQDEIFELEKIEITDEWQTYQITCSLPSTWNEASVYFALAFWKSFSSGYDNGLCSVYYDNFTITEIVATESMGSVNPSITDETITSDTIVDALNQNAEANNEVLANVIPTVDVNEEEIKSAFGEAFIENEKINIEVRPYLNVAVTELDNVHNSMTLDIKAQYEMYAVQEEKEVQIGEIGTLDVANQTMIITVPLPSSFTTKNVVVNHKKLIEGVETVVETLAAIVDEEAGTITFETEKGFSTFEVVGIKVKHNLTLESEIDFSFYIKKADLADHTDLSATITHRRESGDNVVTAEWTEFENTDGTIYWRLRYNGVAAKEIADELVLCITDSAGKEVVIDTYSVKDYAMLCIKQPLNDGGKEADLMTALLNYGAAAQVYFEYREETLANADLGDDAYLYSASVADGYIGPESSFKHNLTLASEIDFSFYVEKAQLPDKEGLTATIIHKREAGDTMVTAEWKEFMANNDTAYWRLRYTGVAAKEMADKIVLNITDSEGHIKFTDTYNVKDYAMLCIVDPLNDGGKEANLMTALLNYGAAAQVYFEYNEENLANAYFVK